MIHLRSAEELRKIKESADLVSDVHAQIIKMVEPGLETIEIDNLVEEKIRGYGATPAFKGYRGFPYSVCVSINEQVVHGFPSNRKLRDGDILSLDIGAFYNGYVGDIARSYGIGTLSKDKDLLIRHSYHALREGCKAAIAGKRVHDISHTVQRVAERYGYGIVEDFVGHGVGTKMHEEPQIPNFGNPGTGPRLRPGMVICIEPMFNLGTGEVKVLKDKWTVVTKDHKPSVHVEDMVAITEEGPVILSEAPGRSYPEELEIELETASVG